MKVESQIFFKLIGGVGRLLCVMALAILLCTSFVLYADSNEGMTVDLDAYVDGSRLSRQAQQKNGIVFLPTRQTGQALGYTVKYNPAYRMVSFTKGAQKIVLTFDLKEVNVNNKMVRLETAPYLTVDEYGYAPVSFFQYLTEKNIGVENGSVIVGEKPKTVMTEINRLVYSDGSVVITADGPISYSSFRLSEPDRIVVDIPNAVLNMAESEQLVGQGGVQKVTAAQYNETVVRITLAVDTEEAFDITQSKDQKMIIVTGPSTEDEQALEPSTPPGDTNEGTTVVPNEEPAAPPIQKQVKSPADLTIYISPGHGGQKPGSQAADGTYEHEFTYAVALKLNDVLKKAGFKTIMARGDNEYVNIYDRTATANQANADFYMSIHFNAFNKVAHGLESLYYPNTPTEENPISNKEIAQIFQEEIVKELKFTDRGVIGRPDLVEMNSTKMPAILCELGFIDNPTELAKIRESDFNDRAANALARAIVRYFQEMRGYELGIDVNQAFQ